MVKEFPKNVNDWQVDFRIIISPSLHSLSALINFKFRGHSKGRKQNSSLLKDPSESGFMGCFSSRRDSPNRLQVSLLEEVAPLCSTTAPLVIKKVGDDPSSFIVKAVPFLMGGEWGPLDNSIAKIDICKLSCSFLWEAISAFLSLDEANWRLFLFPDLCVWSTILRGSHGFKAIEG